MTLTETLPFDFGDTPQLERRVRSRDPETSWEAATIGKEAASEVRDFIVLFLSRRPASTDDQIFAAYRAAGGRRTPQRIRTARQELSKPKTGDPQVKVAGIGVTAAGGSCRTWELI